MRIANLDGRLVLVHNDHAIDVENASRGKFAADPQAIFARWDEFAEWYPAADLNEAMVFDHTRLNSPSPRPRQVFALALNYRAHADEAKMSAPELPAVFTKFQSSITGPYTEVELPKGGNTDWEVELVVVMGRRTRHVSARDAWTYVAGVTVGQDLSERIRQHHGGLRQFSLGKSFPGFSPMGPVLVTIDEFDDPDDLQITSEIDGEVMQHGRTSQMIFSVPVLIEHLSGILELSPGDIIFTGTPSGVGATLTPPRFLQPGETLVSRIEGIGEIRQHFVDAR